MRFRGRRGSQVRLRRKWERKGGTSLCSQVESHALATHTVKVANTETIFAHIMIFQVGKRQLPGVGPRPSMHLRVRGRGRRISEFKAAWCA